MGWAGQAISFFFDLFICQKYFFYFELKLNVFIILTISGSYQCNASSAICLEKWQVRQEKDNNKINT